ncbi:MAG: universal stress protein [Confluentibacter sp.]|nr:universal stress protein [Confluentibacter sp.]
METKSLNVLLPTDFSDNAWNTVVYALKLYQKQACRFYFLHATKIRLKNSAISSSKLSDVIREAATKEMDALKALAESSNINKHHKFMSIISSEDLIDAIEIAVVKHNIDVVILGTKGATGAKKLFFGSNTVGVIKNMRLRPILVVPDEYDFVVPQQIAFPTDFNRMYNHVQLQPILDLATLYHSKLRIVHINKEKALSPVQEENLEILKGCLSALHFSFHWMPDYIKLTKEIHVFIEELNIDMLVMLNYKHSFIQNIVNEPVIANIGFNPKIPFLVVPV